MMFISCWHCLTSFCSIVYKTIVISLRTYYIIAVNIIHYHQQDAKPELKNHLYPYKFTEVTLKAERPKEMGFRKKQAKCLVF